MATATNDKGYIQSIGRRKEALARVRLFKNNKQLTVNGQLIAEYFSGPVAAREYGRPFEVTQTGGEYGATIKVEGGGTASQLDAVVHGLARAIAKADVEKRTALKKAGLLTRDARVKERRKYGLAHAARAKKQSPKR